MISCPCGHLWKLGPYHVVEHPPVGVVLLQTRSAECDDCKTVLVDQLITFEPIELISITLEV